jgi:hypothetical protein
LNSNKPILVAIGFVVASGIIGSILSPANVINILGFCSMVTVSMFSLTKLNEASDRVEQVKVDLAATSDSTDRRLGKIAETGEKTHTLVNSNMGVQLKLGMELSEFKAVTTGKAEDIQAAKLARSMYEEHVKKQATVDLREGEQRGA